MEIKKNITVQERVDFVNFVVASCEVENRHVPALFDYAWRAGVVKYFAQEAWEKIGNDQDDICDFVYSRDGIEIVEHPDIAEVTAGLYEACQEEIKNRREEYMVVYRNVAHPDPLDRVAEAFEEIASGIKSLSDPDMLVEIAKKAGLTGKEPERTGDWKPKTDAETEDRINHSQHKPVVLNIAKKE